MSNSGIYIIKNVINNKCYIGSTINLNLRMRHHLVYGNKYSNIKLQNSIKKHCVDNFKFEILEYVDDKVLLIEKEQYWIDKIKPEYNISKIAGNTMGVKHSEKTKKKIAQQLKGNKNFNNSKNKTEAIDKISKTKKEQYKNGYEHPFLNKFHSDESKEKMSTIKKKNREKNSKLDIEQVSAIKRLLIEGKGVKELAIRFDISQSTISGIKNNKKWKDIEAR